MHFFSLGFKPFRKTLMVLWVLLHKSSSAMLISKSSAGLFSPRFNRKAEYLKYHSCCRCLKHQDNRIINSYFTSEKQSPNESDPTLIGQSESTCSPKLRPRRRSTKMEPSSHSIGPGPDKHSWPSHHQTAATHGADKTGRITGRSRETPFVRLIDAVELTKGVSPISHTEVS